MQSAKNKNRSFDIERLFQLDEERRRLIGEIEKKRAERNLNQESLRRQGYGGQARTKDQEDKIKDGKRLKDEIKHLEENFEAVKQEFNDLMLLVPNVPDKSVPIGKDSSGNIEVRKWGQLPDFDFKPLDHIELLKHLDLVDFERGVKVGGFRSYFLKNEGVLLEMAVFSYTLQKLVKKGFIPLMTPSLVKEYTLIGNGQLPWGREEVYHFPKDDVYLAGTAEVPVTAYHANEILAEKDLPKKYVAISPCFRREAGSYGKDTRGLYRVHQFNKIEQVVIAPDDYTKSLELLEELLKNAEEVLQDLMLPYRVMLMCTGDMGEPQVKKYDIETWMPGRREYGETMSDSFLGDFQARRLNIRFRGKDGNTHFVHTLNNTAVASPRILIALLENYQQKDGSVVVPEVLRDYIGKEKITSQRH